MSALIPFRPFAGLTDLDREFTRAFRGLTGPAFPAAPRLDVREADGKLEVIAELPGFKEDEVQVTVDRDVLTIAAKHEQNAETDRDGYVWRERRASALRRQLRLPEGVKPEDVSASLADGLLTVTVPKANGSEPVRIPVTS